MAHPLHHAESSARRFGGIADDHKCVQRFKMLSDGTQVEIIFFSIPTPASIAR